MSHRENKVGTVRSYMSQGAKDAAWNAWWGTLNSAKAEAGEKRSSNYLFRATRDNINKLSSGKRDYIEELQSERISSYNPYTDSGSDLTGYHRAEKDPFKVDFSSVAEAHDNTKLFDIDPLASAVSQNVTVDNATGVTTLNTAVYGEAPTPELGQNFFQIGLGIADSVMDQFTSIQDANAYNPSGYAANGFGNTDGLFSGFKGGAGDRRDMWGREIKTEGVQDYVEEAGRRWNLDMAGNMTEVNPFTGQPLETAGGMNSFYQASGWDAGQGMWDNATVSNVYGAVSVAESANIWGTSSGVVAASEGLNSFYGTSGWNGDGWNASTIADAYGTNNASNNNWNIFGTASDNSSSGSGSWYGSSSQVSDSSNFFGNNNPAAEQNNWQNSSGNIYASHGHHHASRADDDNRSNWFFSQT